MQAISRDILCYAMQTLRCRAIVAHVQDELIIKAFTTHGEVILIENDRLADALNALPQENREILLMYWFLDMADREIAEHLHLARKTVDNRRLKSYRLLMS